MPLTSKAYDERYYREHAEAGLDYTVFGDWHVDYGEWFVESLGLKGKAILDVGCACGSIMRGIGGAGGVIRGIDLSEHMLTLARQKWPDMSPLLFTCDAINLHLFQDEEFDCIHSNNVAEHWKPELVPFILKELLRVTRVGGILWIALDTTESTQGRNPEQEDATHICIRPIEWWKEKAREAGWTLNDGIIEPMLSHQKDFIKRYNWGLLTAVKLPKDVPPAKQHKDYNPKLVQHETGFWVRENTPSDLDAIRDVYDKDYYHLSRIKKFDVVVDGGAHIGAFTRRALELGASKVIAVEVCPENIDTLKANVEGRAEVVQAALCYTSDMALLNSVWEGCECTGGSCVDPVERVLSFRESKSYRPDFRPFKCVRIQHILDQFNLDRISVLKLNIEASEYNVLGLMSDEEMNRIDSIICEWHRNRSDFFRLLARRFKEQWAIHVLSDAWVNGVVHIIRQ